MPIDEYEIRRLIERVDGLASSLASMWIPHDLTSEIKQLNKSIDGLWEHLGSIENEIAETVFLEKMKTHIVENLRSTDMTRREIVKTLPIFKMHQIAFEMAWKVLEKSGTIMPISHGPGKPRTWHLTSVNSN